MSKSFREQLAIVEGQIAAIEVNKQAAIDKIVAGFATKLETLNTKRAELLVAAESELDLSRVEQGTEVRFIYGRAESKKELTGTVLGRKSQPKGADLIRISTGEGFDAQVVTVYVNNVTAIGPFETAEQVA
jgi:hypothetical protein